jgi:hypothetical protein
VWHIASRSVTAGPTLFHHAEALVAEDQVVDALGCGTVLAGGDFPVRAVETDAQDAYENSTAVGHGIE